jgi:hypothetical protein
MSDSSVVYRIAGAIEAMAGGVGLNAVLGPNTLSKRERLVCSGVSLATIGVGCALLVRPLPTAARIRRRKELTGVLGLLGSWIGNATSGTPQSAMFFPTVCLTGLGAGMGGADSWRQYGSMAGVGALTTTLMRTHPNMLRSQKLAGWGYVGAPLSYVNAAFVGAQVADSSLRIREVTELLAREAKRTESLKTLASTLADLAVAGRDLNGDIETWVNGSLDGLERERTLREVHNGRKSLQAILDAARAGVAKPGDLQGDLEALGDGWRQRGLAERSVKVEVTVEEEVMGLVSPSVVGQIHLLFSRYLQNVLRKEWTTEVGITVTVGEDNVIAIEVSDDGGGEIPAHTGDGLWASHRGFAYSLGGSFQIDADGKKFYVRASAPAKPAAQPDSAGSADRWGVDEGTTLIADALSSTVLTTAIQDAATALIDRDDSRRWPAFAIAVWLGIFVAQRSSSQSTPPLGTSFSLSLLSGAAAVINRDSAWSVNGSMLMTTADVAWHHGAKPATGLLAAHLAIGGARGRGRRDELRLAIDAIVPSVTVVGALLAAKRFTAHLGEREHAIGRALDRADMHLQIHSVLMDHHDLVGAIKIPFGRDPLGIALNSRRDEQQTSYNKIKSEFQNLLADTTDMRSAFERAAAARADGIPVQVEVDPLPEPQHARIGREAAAVAQRASMVDLVALAVRRNLEAFPRDVLGRRGLAQILVSLKHQANELQLSITSIPTRAPEESELEMMASTAAHAGGALCNTSVETVSLCFPIP